MSRAVLSIGSNEGDRLAHLRGAVTAFAPYLVAASGVYETAPWGGIEQQTFYNAVLVVEDPDASPAEWLRRAKAQEVAAERVRTVRWGPRTLDVDLIEVSDGGVSVVSTDPELVLPHPRAHERAFVLVPWLHVEPDAELPGRGSVFDLLAALGVDGVEGRADLDLT